MKSVQIRSFSGPYFSVFRLNTDQKNSVFGQFFRSVFLFIQTTEFCDANENLLKSLALFGYVHCYKKWFLADKIVLLTPLKSTFNPSFQKFKVLHLVVISNSFAKHVLYGPQIYHFQEQSLFFLAFKHHSFSLFLASRYFFWLVCASLFQPKSLPVHKKEI